MSGRREEAKAAHEDRRYWRDLGAQFHLGTLIGWSGRYSATFRRPEGVIEVERGLLAALLELREPRP